MTHLEILHFSALFLIPPESKIGRSNGIDAGLVLQPFRDVACLLRTAAGGISRWQWWRQSLVVSAPLWKRAAGGSTSCRFLRQPVKHLTPHLCCHVGPQSVEQVTSPGQQFGECAFLLHSGRFCGKQLLLQFVHATDCRVVHLSSFEARLITFVIAPITTHMDGRQPSLLARCNPN